MTDRSTTGSSDAMTDRSTTEVGGRGTIRFRVTATATVLVAITLVVTSVVLVLVQRDQLLDGLDDSVRVRSDELRAVVESGGDLPDAPSDDAFAQVVVDGEVVDASRPAAAGAPLATTPGTQRVRLDDDSFHARATALPSLGVGAVLVVGESDEDIADGVRVLATSLAVAVPLLTALLAIVVWFLVGRTLAPVEDIRRAVDELGDRSLDVRMPEPDTDDEIARLARTMNHMLDRLDAATRRERHFVADASHELRSPLTRMRTTLDVTDRRDAADVADALDELSSEVDALDELVRDLLHLARTDAVGLERSRRTDLDDVVLREARRLRDRGRVTVDSAAVSAGCVTGDPGALARLVRNLVENAERHASSTVELALHEEAGWVELTVADDGPGIGAGDAERVFERFTRLDDARTSDRGGSGLGLAIVRDVAARHGGSARLVPSTGGARFVVRLPAAP